MSEHALDVGTKRPPVAAASRIDLKRARLLIVDDNQKALDILAQTLLGFGVRNPLQASSAAEAMRFLDNDSLDLLIVDGEMPELDGFALTEHVRSEPASVNYTVPIMILSSFTPRDKVIRARDAGANLVVTKPIVPAVLLGRLEWLARNNRQFITSPGYRGPDRRFKKAPLPEGMAERRADEIKLIAQPERAMSQNEIDSIFG